MPRKHAQKPYIAGAHYHLYNRGVNKGKIFFSPSDYWVFRRYIREACEYGIHFHSFALLENHFHFHVSQDNERDLTKFLKVSMNRYRAYIKKKYNWKGHLSESSCQAVYFSTQYDQLRIQDYILSNPLKAGLLSWRHVGLEP